MAKITFVKTTDGGTGVTCGGNIVVWGGVGAEKPGHPVRLSARTNKTIEEAKRKIESSNPAWTVSSAKAPKGGIDPTKPVMTAQQLSEAQAAYDDMIADKADAKSKKSRERAAKLRNVG